MTRLEYLKKEVAKYCFLSSLTTILYIIDFIVILFLTIHTTIYWVTHDNLTNMQLLKYSLSKFWYLYIYIILFVFLQGTFNSISHLYKSFKKQLEDEVVEDEKNS